MLSGALISAIMIILILVLLIVGIIKISEFIGVVLLIIASVLAGLFALGVWKFGDKTQ